MKYTLRYYIFHDQVDMKILHLQIQIHYQLRNIYYNWEETIIAVANLETKLKRTLLIAHFMTRFDYGHKFVKKLLYYDCIWLI